MQMLHPDGSGPTRPVDVPILIAAPDRRVATMAGHDDGVFATTTLEGLEPGAFDWVADLYWGTVRQPTRTFVGAGACRGRSRRCCLSRHLRVGRHDAVPDIPAARGGWRDRRARRTNATSPST